MYKMYITCATRGSAQLIRISLFRKYYPMCMYMYTHCSLIFNVSGNTKLVSLSGAVKLAAVSNIQIPGTVIQTIKKYCKVSNGECLNVYVCCLPLSSSASLGMIVQGFP